MFYRRKVILALLQSFNGNLEKIRLQKLLFLFTSQQTKADYDFVPYKYGCFSYSATADMNAMSRKGFLEDGHTFFRRLDTTDYVVQLKPDDQIRLREIKFQFGSMNKDSLMKYTYHHYPFYAIHSEVAEKILTPIELQKVTFARPNSTDTILFTIGYEGISLEEYLVRLLKNNVQVLVDVRNNPLSMKYGFSKSHLKKYCESLGIQYIHIPEVGIPSSQRQELSTQKDYDDLFTEYRNTNLPSAATSQQNILQLLIQHHRIALTCFEANIHQCHRKHLAEAIQKLPGFHYDIQHI
ncbi:MAG: DUF488 domain-containing protein [Saprospiraceae bacterium]